MMLLRRVSLRRSVKPLAVVVAAVAGLLFGAGSAQAAASISISNDFVLPGNGTLIATGTATCDIPSGAATIEVSASEIVWIPTNNPPYHIVSGTGSTTISCAASPVSWTVTVPSGPYRFWAPGFLTNVKATLSQAGAVAVSSSAVGYPHY